jgi:hypothetical protein
VLLLESGDSLKGELESSLKNKDSRVWILERERSSGLDLRENFAFSEWPTD